jgi:hypothetical protein
MQKKRNVQPIKQINVKGVFNMKRKFSLMFLCVLLAFAAQAHALLITQPITGPPFPSELVAWGDDTSQNDINTAIASTIAPAVELYKRNVGQTDEGTLAGSYDTVYSPTTDPSGATITFTGGDFVGDPAFLLVKDGNQDDSALFAWYLFDLTALGWLGKETIELSAFWLGNGSISHVALYGTLDEGQPIPEPVSMLLFGTGLVGVGGYIRRKLKK